MAENADNKDVRFTLEEVGKHKTEKDCWIVVNGKVMDITPFLSLHPGGDDILLDGAGTDLSNEFEDTGHSTDARKQMEKYVIGFLDGADLQKKAEKGGAASATASGSVNPAVLVAILVAIAAALYLLLNP